MKDQQVGDQLTVAMEPIADSDGWPFVFTVGRSAGGSWLSVRAGLLADQWDPEDAFVFVSRTRQKKAKGA